MRNPNRTPLLDAASDRLCNEDGPALPAPSLFATTGNAGLTGSSVRICARAVLANIVERVHSLCDVDQQPNDQLLLFGILPLMTPPARPPPSCVSPAGLSRYLQLTIKQVWWNRTDLVQLPTPPTTAEGGKHDNIGRH